MNIIEILKLLFVKIGEQDSISNSIDSLLKIPHALKITLGAVIFIGIIYFGFSKLCLYEITSLHEEVNVLQTIISKQVNKDEYGDDIFYLMEAITLNEEVNKYAYEEELLQLDLIAQYLKRHNPNDPILIDIDAMKKRNETYYLHYSKQFAKVLNKCKRFKRFDETENTDKENTNK